MVKILLLLISFTLSTRVKDANLDLLAKNIYSSMTTEPWIEMEKIPLYTPDLEEYAKLYIFQSKSREYYSIILSEYTELPPVMEFGKGLYRPFLFKEKIKKATGIENYTVDAKLIYTGLSCFYVKPASSDEYYDVQFFKSRKKEEVSGRFIYSKLPENYVKRNTGKWEKIRENGYTLLFTKQANIIDSVPAFLWSYGCSPTSSAMIMAYWDKRGYGRLLDYYFDRYDPVVGDWVYNVPNVQRELAIAMNTDTVTTGGTSILYIPSGNTSVTNTTNGYSFTSQILNSSSTQDYAYSFSCLQSEIDAGRPVHWAVLNYVYYGDTIDHSTCAVGYEIAAPDTYVVLHNTWDTGTWWWPLYTPGCDLFCISVVPGGAVPQNFFITSQEIFLVNNLYTKIYYDTVGTGIDFIEARVSYDGGFNWEFYWYFPVGDYFTIRPQDPPSNNIRIMAYASAASNVVAGDGVKNSIQLISFTDTSNLLITGFDAVKYELKSLFLEDSILYAGTVNGIEKFFISSDTLFDYLGEVVEGLPAYSIDADSIYKAVSAYDKGFFILKNDSIIFQDSTPTYVQDIEIEGTTVYTFERNAGIRILNLEPTPTYVCTLSTSYYAMSGRVYGNYLFVGAVPDGIHVYDITLTLPQEVLLFGDGAVFDVELSGNLLYVLYTGSVAVYDISSPLSPQLLATLSVSNVQSIKAYGGDLVALIKGNYGLDIYQLTNNDTLLLTAHVGGIGNYTSCTFSGYNRVFFGIDEKPFFLATLTASPVKEEYTSRHTYTIPSIITKPILNVSHTFMNNQKIKLIDPQGRLIRTLFVKDGKLYLPSLNKGIYFLMDEKGKNIKIVKF